jgi:hypothetical protein
MRAYGNRHLDSDFFTNIYGAAGYGYKTVMFFTVFFVGHGTPPYSSICPFGYIALYEDAGKR